MRILFAWMFRNNNIGVDLDHAGALLELIGSSVSAEKADAAPATVELGGTLRVNGEHVTKLEFTAK